MLDFFVFKRIIVDGYDCIRKDSDNERIVDTKQKLLFFVLTYLISIIAMILPWVLKVRLSDMENFISSGTAIFTGLFFSLLLSVGDKIRIERDSNNRDNDNYKKFKNNMKQISSITLLSIFIGIILFMLMLVNRVLVLIGDYPYIEIILTSITLLLLWQFTVTLLYMTQRFYFTLKDELNNLF